MKRITLLVLFVFMCFSFTACVRIADDEKDSGSVQQNKQPDNTATPTSTPTPTLEPTPEPEPENIELTFGSSFIFDDLEITFGSEVEWDILKNQFSDLDGADAFGVPIAVKNISDDTHGLNMFYYKQYGTKGTELDSIWAFFNEDISKAGDMRSGATAEAYMYFLYDGDGDYYVEFSKLAAKDKIEVKFPISK